MSLAATRIKICGIRSTEAAVAACDAGADAIGLVFYEPSPRAVTLQVAAGICGSCTPLVSTVGLFVDATETEVSAVLRHCPLDLLQFHGSETAEFCEQFDRPYIKAVSMRPDVDVRALVEQHPRARAFLLDAWRDDSPGGTGETFDWGRVPAMERPWMLAGGLTAQNIGDAIDAVAPPAVDVSGGVERSRGEKDPEKIYQFVAAVRAADQRRLEEAAA